MDTGVQCLCHVGLKPLENQLPGGYGWDMAYGTSKTHGVFKEIPLLTTTVDGQFTFPPAVSLSSMSSIYANISLHDFLSDWSEMESQCNFDLLFFGGS